MQSALTSFRTDLANSKQNSASQVAVTALRKDFDTIKQETTVNTFRVQNTLAALHTEMNVNRSEMNIFKQETTSIASSMQNDLRTVNKDINKIKQNTTSSTTMRQSLLKLQEDVDSIKRDTVTSMVLRKEMDAIKQDTAAQVQSSLTALQKSVDDNKQEMSLSTSRAQNALTTLRAELQVIKNNSLDNLHKEIDDVKRGTNSLKQEIVSQVWSALAASRADFDANKQEATMSISKLQGTLTTLQADVETIKRNSRGSLRKKTDKTENTVTQDNLTMLRVELKAEIMHEMQSLRNEVAGTRAEERVTYEFQGDMVTTQEELLVNEPVMVETNGIFASLSIHVSR
jgi:hypothetical protein